MRTIIVIVALLSLTLVATADTLVYWGETTDIKSYIGGSDALWDYVYQISPWTSMNTPMWGIVCPVEPEWHGATTGWTYAYYTSIPDLGMNFVNIVGEPGVVWTYTGDPATGTTGYFHFQSSVSPTKQLYGGDGWTNGTETEYSASPEPASIILSSLALGFVLYRRRQKSQVG